MEARRRIPALLPLLALAGSLAVVAASPARATVYNVDTTADVVASDGFCSLREAIRAADQDIAWDTCPAGDADDVIHLPAGTYDFSHGEEVLQWPGSIRIEGAGPESTRIDMGGQNSFVEIEQPPSVAITGLTLSNGWSSDFRGGAVYADDAFLDLEDVRFESNQADNVGGGLGYQAANASLEMHRVTFVANHAVAGGGGAWVSIDGPAASAELHDVAFQGNTATIGGGLDLYASDWAETVCSRCVFESNATSEAEGGAHFYAFNQSRIRVVDSRFVSNRGNSALFRSISFNATAYYGSRIDFDRISCLRAESGSAGSYDVILNSWDASISLTNSLLADSLMNGLEAISDSGSHIEISQATIVGHGVLTGATLLGRSGGTVTLENSLVTQNGTDLLVTPQSVVLSDNFIGGDPLFVPADPAYHLAPGSPAIDACDSPTAPYRVADLEHRPRVVGAAPDCGAQEAGDGIFADGFETGDAGSWSLTY